MRRFKSNRFTIKPNNNESFSKIIDTSVFYQVVWSEEFISEYNLQGYHNGFKFYNNGRFGHFKGIDFNKKESFNPKKATMGYYDYNEKGFFLEDLYEIPGGIYKLSRKEILLSESFGDTLVVKSFKSATSSEGTAKYVKRKIPKEALSYKPDW